MYYIRGNWVVREGFSCNFVFLASITNAKCWFLFLKNSEFQMAPSLPTPP
jgi:hypothetical protein